MSDLSSGRLGRVRRFSMFAFLVGTGAVSAWGLALSAVAAEPGDVDPVHQRGAPAAKPPPGSGGDSKGPAAGSKLRLAGPGAPAQRDRLQVRRLLDRLRAPLQACMLRQLKRDPSFRGLPVPLAVSPEGSVRLQPERLGEPLPVRLGACIKRVATAHRAAPASGGELRLSLPFAVALPTR